MPPVLKPIAPKKPRTRFWVGLGSVVLLGGGITAGFMDGHPVPVILAGIAGFTISRLSRRKKEKS